MGAEAASTWTAAGGERLDQFMRAQVPDWSRARLQAQIRMGAVRVNGAEQRKPGLVLRGGDRVQAGLGAAPPVAAEALAEPIPLAVLYEDDELAVLDKPAGLVVHPGSGVGSGTLVNALLHRYGRLARGGGPQRPGIVHRLDRLTSGVMVVARTDAAHQRLGEQFQARSVIKLYRALVHGIPGMQAGEIQLPIGRDLRQRVRMTTRRPAAHARSAHTSYRVLEAFPPPAPTPPSQRSAWSFSLLELRLHTGRTHQIRVHLAALGHPVVGDRLYGAAAELTGSGLAEYQPARVMLHAAELEFTHTVSGARMHFQAPLPAEMDELAQRLRQRQVARAAGL
ncbi:MAG: RluA family pseudouridine synthase [Terriglobales bacterium]